MIKSYDTKGFHGQTGFPSFETRYGETVTSDWLTPELQRL